MVSKFPKQILGKDFHYFNRITVDGYEFTEFADVFFNFRASNMTFSLVWEGTGVIEYSFSGTKVHGDMENGQPTAAIFFDDRCVQGIWFRISSGGGGTVRVEGWAK